MIKWLSTLATAAQVVVIVMAEPSTVQKCCDFNSSMVMKNNSYICDHNNTSRVVINTVYTEINNSMCVEAYGNSVFLFSLEKDTFNPTRNISHEIPRKCCPENFAYVARKHACEEANETAGSSGIARIGLPNCRVIRDYFFESLNDIKMNDTHLYVKQEDVFVPKDRYCIDTTTDSYFVLRICEGIGICEQVRCLHKCCPDGQSFVNGSFCRDTFVHGLNIAGFNYIENNNDTQFAIIHRQRKVPVYLDTSPKRIDFRGRFFTENPIEKKMYSPYDEAYCIEYATKNNRNYGHRLFKIHDEELSRPLPTKFIYYRVAMIVSEVFLTATIVIYIWSHGTRNVFGKALISFCCAFFMFFAHLIFLTFHKDLNKKKTFPFCLGVAFSHYYFGFSSFAWLQILCFDIYWTFGSTNLYHGLIDKKRRDLKRFIFYSIYGWGLPVLITGFYMIFYFTDILPDPIRIKIGINKCSMENDNGNYAELLFKTVPLTLIEAVNFIYFVKTVIYIWKVKGEIHKMNDNIDNLKKKKKRFFAKQERFKLVVKLSITMGISYLFEVVSSFYDFSQNAVAKNIEIAWDVINCSQGLFIFIIFVCKMRNFKRCRDSFAVERIRKISLSSTTRTTTLSLSSTKKRKRISNDENNK